ncbi:hypothetical protein QOZ80_3AG0250380 [Eleusine coracana subsp. coracana]|nr:hypothetical protein QOZ80_3AG0250380 [Eleusine coracana subsp. coracana]
MEKRSKLCHRHIVPLIGYCNDNDQTMLVYKYMARGSLREQLFNTQKPPLTWIQRLEICIGAARGLDYLHRGADHDAIIHRNVKLSNILLDEEWDALISDNLETDTSEVFIGSNEPGAPLYVTSRHSQRTDVYYFCVVLFEVLCGRPHFDSSVPREQFNLVEWAARCREEGNLDRIVDPYLRGKITKECLNKFVETAEHSASMEAVVSGLERALGFQLNGEGSGSK